MNHANEHITSDRREHTMNDRPGPMRRHAALLTALASCCLAFVAVPAAAQTAIRAHYDNGQVWVVWEASAPLPETFAIYGSDAPIHDWELDSMVDTPAD